jgi:hypothetical protein
MMTAVLLVGLPVYAYGYTDPGTGAFLYQAFFATLMGLVWTGRKMMRRVFDRRNDKKDKSS